jgi:hypothetical protein
MIRRLAPAAWISAASVCHLARALWAERRVALWGLSGRGADSLMLPENQALALDHARQAYPRERVGCL